MKITRHWKIKSPLAATARQLKLPQGKLRIGRLDSKVDRAKYVHDGTAEGHKGELIRGPNAKLHLLTHWRDRKCAKYQVGHDALKKANTTSPRKSKMVFGGEKGINPSFSSCVVTQRTNRD